MIEFDWFSEESHLFVSPAYSQEHQVHYQNIVKESSLKGHIWLTTSGTKVAKWVGLSKQGILNSAAAVNSHLEANARDIWVHALPDFHIGGLSIWARSQLASSEVRDFKKCEPKWQPAAFHAYVEATQGTLTALVSTQLYDLIQLGLKSPSSLRAVIIGGGKLGNPLYQKAVELGWKVLPSYGMTECASQIATASLGSWERNQEKGLKILSHLDVRKEADGRLSFKGNSLLSTYAYLDVDHTIKFIDPKQDGWYTSEDMGSIENGYLFPRGRGDRIVKIAGESVNLDDLESILQAIRLESPFAPEMVLWAKPDERLGFALQLVVTEITEQVKTIRDKFQQKVLPFEKIREMVVVKEIPKTPTGKVIYSKL